MDVNTSNFELCHTGYNPASRKATNNAALYPQDNLVDYRVLQVRLRAVAMRRMRTCMPGSLASLGALAPNSSSTRGTIRGVRAPCVVAGSRA